MKRIASILIVVILALCFTGCNNQSTDNSESQADTATSTFVNVTEEESDHTKPTVYRLDSLMEADLQASQSNYETTQVYVKYTTEWENLMNEYYSLIQEYDNPDWGSEIPALVKEQQLRWEEYIESEKLFIEDYFTNYFQGGTATPGAICKSVCMLYKERAIQLYGYCTDLSIECDAP